MNKEDHYVLQEKEQEQPREMAYRYDKYALCFHGAGGSEIHRDLCAGKCLKKEILEGLL